VVGSRTNEILVTTSGGTILYKNKYVVSFNSQGARTDISFEPMRFDEWATRVFVDESGNIYVSGIVDEDLAWIEKYNSETYTLEWSKYPFDSYWQINGIGVNRDGDVVVAGKTTGYSNAWVERLRSSDGESVWLKIFDVAGEDSFEALAFDANGGIILAGYTESFKTNLGSTDALLMRYADSAPLLLPSITSFSPSSGSRGDTIRINGTNLTGITQVRFNGAYAEFTIVSSTAIDVVVPWNATTGLITISRDCDSVSSPMPFTVTP